MPLVVTCADCGCDTGASNFTSVQNRLQADMSPVWRATGCRDKSCNCHYTAGALRERTASGTAAILSLRVEVR